MNEPRIASNVYYLPVPAAPLAVAVPARPPAWWSALTRTWWRLRFALAEIRAVFRRPLPALLPDEHVSLARDARPPVRPDGPPARVLDFAAFAARATSPRVRPAR